MSLCPICDNKPMNCDCTQADQDLNEKEKECEEYRAMLEEYVRWFDACSIGNSENWPSYHINRIQTLLNKYS